MFVAFELHDHDYIGELNQTVHMLADQLTDKMDIDLVKHYTVKAMLAFNTIGRMKMDLASLDFQSKESNLRNHMFGELDVTHEETVDSVTKGFFGFVVDLDTKQIFEVEDDSIVCVNK